MPDISVIMLTFNREQLLERAIKSILSQTFANFEYIIVDNGSTDNSGRICDDYALRDYRIKVIHKEKGNIGSGRNAGLDAANGKYITFVDDDDIAYPDMLEFLYNLAEDNKADISVCGSTKEVDGKVLSNCVFNECLVMGSDLAVTELLKRKKYNAATPTKLWKRELFDKTRFYDTGKYDDITVVYKLFAQALRVVAQGIPKYCFCRHIGNNSAFTTSDKLLKPQQLEDYFAAFRERTSWLSEKLPEIADYAQYSEWSYMISMCNKISSNKLDNCKKQLDFIKDELLKHYEEFYYSPYIEEFEKEFMDKYLGRKAYE